MVYLLLKTRRQGYLRVVVLYYIPSNVYHILQVPSDTSDLDRAWLDISLSAHYLDGPDSMTPELEELLSRFPDWTVPLGWVATLQHYRI